MAVEDAAPIPPDGSTDSPAVLGDLARRLGHDAWIERRTFEVCGVAATRAADDQLAVWFDAVGRHHGWHAQLCRDRLPELAALDPESLVRPPGAGTVAFFDAFAESASPADDGGEEQGIVVLEVLVGVLLPTLLARHRHLLRSAPVVSAASVHRWYGFMIADDTEDLLRGSELRHERLALPGPDAVSSDVLTAAVDASARFAAMALAARGLHS